MKRLASMAGWSRFAVLAVMSIGLVAEAATSGLSNAKPVPRLQAIPQPYDQISFQRDGQEITRLHFGTNLNRPFLFPAIGPAGVSVTRIGHPQDPVGHSHHNSIWISHNDVNGFTFWGDRGTNLGRILTQRVEKLEDGDTAAAATILNHWVDKAGKVLLEERRRVEVQLLDGKEWQLVLDLRFEAKGKPVTFGKTSFGLLGVRMAKTIGVKDGGGTIRNSEGNVDEAGDNGCFWKRAKWCDYSGPVQTGVIEGATILDHPANPNHPTQFHVRVDGWMGTCLTFDEPLVVEPGKPLRLRYGVYVHGGLKEPQELQARWAAFAKTALADLEPKKK